MHESEPLNGLKEREICPVEGCSGDPNYLPPGRGHMEGCYYPYESVEDKNEVGEALARQRYGIELEPEDFVSNIEPVLLEAQPSTESKIIISLLMRIYDVQMALLTKVDPDTADKLYDAHERGEDFNPTIYIPEIKDDA